MRTFDNRSILYLHGYDSSSQGKKAQILREFCPRNRLLIPDLPLEPSKCMDICEESLKTASNDTIIIGASLGAFYAYYLAKKYERSALLINPLTKPSKKIKQMIDIEENLEKKKLLLDAFNIYLTYEKNLDSLTKEPKECFVALAKRDTVIDTDETVTFFKNTYIKQYDDDHLMIESFTKILEDFQEYLEEEI